MMINTSTAEDIVYSNLFTGRAAITESPIVAVRDGSGKFFRNRMRLNEFRLPTPLANDAKPKAWKEIWGSGQGVGSVRHDICPAADLSRASGREYARPFDPRCEAELDANARGLRRMTNRRGP